MPLPSPPMSPDSPMTSSDSEVFSPESPTVNIKSLDPAHRPSPRAIQALRRQRPPLTVINDDNVDGSSRLLSPPTMMTTTAAAAAADGHTSWRGLWSSSSVESIAGIHCDPGLRGRGFRGPFTWGWRRHPVRVVPMTSTPYRRSYRRVNDPDDQGICYHPGRTLKIVAVVAVVLCVALSITLVPTLLITQRMVRHKSAAAAGRDDLFASFRERPAIVAASWCAPTCCFI